MYRPALASLLPETTQDPLSWAYHPLSLGAPLRLPPDLQGLTVPLTRAGYGPFHSKGFLANLDTGLW